MCAAPAVIAKSDKGIDPSMTSKMANSASWLDKKDSSSTVIKTVKLIRKPTLTTAARRLASCVRQVGNRLL